MSELVDKAEAALRAGRYADARDALERALADGLDRRLESEARSMLGLSLLMTDEADRGLVELRAAVLAEPGEAMFHYNLARGLEQAGDVDAAIGEHREAVRLSNGMQPLKLALGNALAAGGRYGEALPLLQPFATASGAAKPVIRLYAQCLHGVGDLHGAIDQARRLQTSDLARADALERSDALLLARLCQGAMFYEEATRIGEALLAYDPGDAEAAAMLAPLVLWTEGPEAARRIIERALECNANMPALLVQFLGYNDIVDEQFLCRTEALAGERRLPQQTRSELWLALAQFHDRVGDADRAWEFAKRGNALAPAADARDWRNDLERHLAFYREATPAGAPAGAPLHFYLCGLPRSGQSLVQSILAAAPGVVSAGERGALLPHLLWRGEDVSAMSPSQRATLFAELERADRRGLARLLSEPANLVVDKNPFNLAVAGSIARVHIGARFGASLRDPADVAVSIYLRSFPSAYDYAADFAQILDHLDYSLDAIAAWRDAGLEMLLLEHAALLADPAKEGAKLFDWLGLGWDEGFLAPERRTQPVPTFSAAQVRKPIGKGGSRGAEPYSAHIEPFMDRIEALREKQGRLLRRG